jgi:hypothetical protein
MVTETAPMTAPPATGGTAAPATIKTDPAATEASQGYPDVAVLDIEGAIAERAGLPLCASPGAARCKDANRA